MDLQTVFSQARNVNLEYNLKAKIKTPINVVLQVALCIFGHWKFMFLFDKLDILQGEFISYALVHGLALQAGHGNLCSNSLQLFFSWVI